MCLSIPKRVVEWEGEGEFAGDFAWVERDGQRERVNMMPTGCGPISIMLTRSRWPRRWWRTSSGS